MVHLPEPRPIRAVAADGVRLAGQWWQPAEGPGAGVTCVVAHGFTGSSRNRDVVRICRHLAGQGFGVVSLDFRGHGRSGGLGTAGVDEAHDVDAAVAWARAQGARTVVTLGWSMGGTAVLRQAGLGGDTDAVVSVSAPGLWGERGTRPMRIVHWLFEARSGRVALRLARRTRVTSGGWRVEPESPAALAGRITVPLLVVHGTEDSYFPMRHPEALAAGAPGAEVWIEPGMGHAELATTGDLLDRIARWVLAVTDASRR